MDLCGYGESYLYDDVFGEMKVLFDVDVMV